MFFFFPEEISGCPSDARRNSKCFLSVFLSGVRYSIFFNARVDEIHFVERAAAWLTEMSRLRFCLCSIGKWVMGSGLSAEPLTRWCELMLFIPFSFRYVFNVEIMGLHGAALELLGVVAAISSLNVRLSESDIAFPNPNILSMYAYLLELKETRTISAYDLSW